MVIYVTLTTYVEEELNSSIWFSQIPFNGDAQYYVAVVFTKSVLLRQFENTDFEQLIFEIKTYLNEFNPVKIELSFDNNIEPMSDGNIVFINSTLSLNSI